jgi:hypothetical protein
LPVAGLLTAEKLRAYETSHLIPQQRSVPRFANSRTKVETDQALQNSPSASYAVCIGLNE